MAAPYAYYESVLGDFFGPNSNNQIVNRLEASRGLAIFHHFEMNGRYEVWKNGCFAGGYPSLVEAEDVLMRLADDPWSSR
jgi:hypothetical protein